MSLERLVEEIRHKARDELEHERQRVEAEKQRIAAERDQRIAQIREEIERRTQAEVARERTQKLAGARLQARKMVYEAKEKEMAGALTETRRLLEAFTQTKGYPALLKRMYASAAERLGSSIRVSGRKEDAPVLESIAGKSFAKTPISIIGGLVVETTNGEQRLNLSLDELLRLREDKIRALLSA
jgi:vacuolar-type H+-ATPase subunit E/Vma4